TNRPEYTRKYASRPTYGSVTILNASAENGSSSVGFRSTGSLVRGSMPTTGGTSSGDGRNSTTASSSSCTPLFFSALPHITGVAVLASATRRSAAWISCTVSLCPSTKLIIVCSSTSPM